MRKLLLVLMSAAGVLSVPAFAKEGHAVRSAQHFATELPFHECDGLICIDVMLDGAKPRSLMLDTGDVHSTVITDVAKELGWSLQPLLKDGKPVPGIYRGGDHRVALGGIEAKMDVFVFDRDLLGEYKPPVDGSITYDFFKDRVLQIDYPAHRLRISGIVATPVTDHSGKSGTLKLITFGEHGPPVVVGGPFTVNGKRLRAQIDTCYTGTLLVYDSAVAQLGLTKQGKPELFRYTDGGVNMLAAPAQSIGFGSQVITKNPTLYFVGEGNNPVHQPDGLFEGTVGNALFAHSIVTLDFHAMTLEVQPAG